MPVGTESTAWTQMTHKYLIGILHTKIADCIQNLAFGIIESTHNNEEQEVLVGTMTQRHPQHLWWIPEYNRRKTTGMGFP